MSSWPAEPKLRNAVKQAPAPVFDVCGVTHGGLVREHNEDAWLADAALGLAVVADGLGGHADGGLASRDVVDCIADHLQCALAGLIRASAADRGAPAQERATAHAIELAHKRLLAANAGITDSRNCRGSTVAGLWAPPLPGAPVTIFHVGDSRLYLQREHKLTALTRDHSVYERWVDEGKRGTPPPRNQILQALGVTETILPAIASFKPRRGDRMLLCTDGLTGGVGDAALAQVLDRTGPLSAKCEELVALALAGGGKDNLTIVLCTFPQSRSSR